MTNAVLWVEVVVFAIFVALRLYTRRFILNTVGLDDHLVLIALVGAINDNITSNGKSLTVFRLCIFSIPPL